MIRMPMKLFDVEFVFISQFNWRKLGLGACPEINVATPPKRNLDDVRLTIHIGPLKFAVIFAHLRYNQEYEL